MRPKAPNALDRAWLGFLVTEAKEMPDVALVHARRAFYAGAIALIRLAEPDTISDLIDELVAFADDVLGGRS